MRHLFIYLLDRTLPVTALLLFICLSGYGQPEFQIMSVAPMQPYQPGSRVELIRERLAEARSDMERFALQTQLIAELQALRATPEVIAAYEDMLDMPQMVEPDMRYRWMLQYGTFLERQGYYEDAARVYRQFLEQADSLSPPQSYAYRAGMEYRLLSAYIQSGAFQQAKDMAFDILNATGSPIQLPLLESILELAESDILSLSELDKIESLLLQQSVYQQLIPRLVRLYLNQGRPENGIAVMEYLLKDNPGLFLNSLDVAQEVYCSTDTAQGAERLLAALESHRVPGDRSGIYDLIRVRWLDRVGRTSEAIQILEGYPPENELFQKELATIHFNRENYAAAAEAFLRLFEQNSQNSFYLRQVGECHYRMGNKQEAIATWERIPVVEGHTAASYQLLAEIYHLRALNREAIATLKKARGRQGIVESDLVSKILDLWLEVGDYEELLKEYLRESLLRPEVEPTYRLRIIEQRKTPEKARQLLAALHDRLEKDVDQTRQQFLRQLGTDLYVAIEDYGSAIDFVKSAYSGSPEIGLRLYYLGMELNRRAAVEWAVNAWAAIPQNSPYFVQASDEMAQISLRLGRLEEARSGAEGILDHLFSQIPPHAGLAGSPRDATVFRTALPLFRGMDYERLVSAIAILVQVDLREKKPGDALHWLLMSDSLVFRNRPGFWSLMLGHAYSQLGSLETAERHYRDALRNAMPDTADLNEAEFFLAECLLWQEKITAAMDIYMAHAENSPQSDYADDALRRYLVTAFAEAQQLYYYTLATLFEWKGDVEEAIRLYREAAAEDAGGDIAGWCLYEVARLLLDQNRYEAAQRQIDHILERYEHPSLLAECRLLLVRMPGVERAGTVLEATGIYREILLDYPNTLYSDLVRLKLDGRLEQPF